MGGDLLQSGTVVAERYRVEQLIGGGGFGKVYRATDLQVERHVALKVLHSELVANAESKKRFEREALLARRLRHPNTVLLLDHGATAESCFIVYELLRGRSLSTELKGTTGLTAERVGHIAAQALRALGEAHALGIVHRDVKPANLFLTWYAGENDFVKLLDFGIGKDLENSEAEKLTQTGQTLGTPIYMAPEQITGKPATSATDLYAVGLMAAEMITGTRVYAGQALSVIAQKLSGEPPPLARAVHEHRFGPVIVRATHRDPAARYQSAAEMLAHLERIEHAMQPAPPAEAAPTVFGAPRLPPAMQAQHPSTRPHAPPPAFAPKQRSAGTLALVVLVGVALATAAVVAGVLMILDDETESARPKPRTRDVETLPVRVPAPSAAAPSVVPVRELDAARIRAAVEAEGYRVIAERTIRDEQAGTQTLQIEIEKDPVNHGIIHLTTCRSAEQARTLGRQSEAVVDGNVFLFVNVSAQDDAGERIRTRLVPASSSPATPPADSARPPVAPPPRPAGKPAPTSDLEQPV
jgi:serine/threonine-protein kinase